MQHVDVDATVEGSAQLLSMWRCLRCLCLSRLGSDDRTTGYDVAVAARSLLLLIDQNTTTQVHTRTILHLLLAGHGGDGHSCLLVLDH